MQKIKICIDARVLESENHGISRYLRENIYWLSKKENIEIFLISNKKIILKDFICLDNIHIIEDNLYKKIPGTIWLIFFANRIINKIKPDLFWGPAHILPVYKFKNIKYVVTVHDIVHIFFPETMNTYNKYISKILFKRSMVSADLIFSVSETTKKDLLRNISDIRCEKVVVNYLGGAEKFSKYSRKEEKKDKVKKIFLLGSLEPRKNINYFLRVFKECLDIDPNIHLYITGSVSWKSTKSMELINSKDLGKNVTILGFISDEEIEKSLNKFDLLVIPSIYEGFGLPLIEAQGKINILVSNIDVFKEIGRFFNDINYLDLNKNVSDNALNILKVLSSNSECSLKSNSYELFTWEYSSNVLYNKIIELFN